jgi:kynurenine formamidase
MIRPVAVLLVAGILGCGRGDAGLLQTGQWIDLTHEFSPETIYWPTAKPFELEVVSAERTPAGYYYAANNFTAAEHGGTHLDAPVHFAEGK